MNFVETLIHEGNRIAIVSGEGSVGAVETYHGARTMRAIKERLTKERCGGARWAKAKVFSHTTPWGEVWVDVKTSECGGL